MSLQDSPILADRANTNAEKVIDLRTEVLEECKDIQERIHTVRRKVEGHIGGYKNLDGFLTGPIENYLDEFDS